jgi:ribulose-phosphate 3-epimerase
MKTLIAPSILSADFGRLDDEIKAVEQAGADWIHVDVMDGMFVPNLTIGPLVVKAARKATKLPLDVHLMIIDPNRYLKEFADAGADHLVVHQEACVHLHRSLQVIKGLGKRAGVSYIPSTPLNGLEHVIDLVDIVLIMLVNPGFGGQSFIEAALPKVEQARQIIDASGRDIDLQVDGGVSPENSASVIAAGANALVAGSAVYGQKDYKAAIDEIRSGGAV